MSADPEEKVDETKLKKVKKKKILITERATPTAGDTKVVLEPVKKMALDIKEAAVTLTSKQARYLVDMYYSMQDSRIGAGNQVFALGESGEPNATLNWFEGQSHSIENQVKNALDMYSNAHALGRWARSIVGIGPVISAGLLAYIDIDQAPTVGHIWRFAGLDPTQHWLGREKGAEAVSKALEDTGGSFADAIPIVAGLIGTRPETLQKIASHNRTGETVPITTATLCAAAAKRPWNASLKVLCWKIGESFVKVSNNDQDYYGHLYANRKYQETQKNDAGGFTEQASKILATKKYKRDTDAYKAYSAGKLPPGHIHARAKRWVVKQFLADYHHIGFFLKFNRLPPLPYPLVFGNHNDLRLPPNVDLVPGLKEVVHTWKQTAI